MKRRWKRWLKRFLRDNELFLIAVLDIVLLGFLAMLLVWLFMPAKASAMEAEELPEVSAAEQEADRIQAADGGEGDMKQLNYGSLYMTQEELAEEEYYDSLELLALCVEAEAGNQGLEGKRAVVAVILNRVEDPDWPDTITGVISDKYEFSSYWNGAIDAVWEPSEETFQAVRMELEERSYPEVYYFSAKGFVPFGTPWEQIGDHYFSTK